MSCVICKQTEVQDGFTTVTLERDGLTFVVKRVPAQVCPNCGEAYVAEDISSRILQVAEKAAREGAQVDVRQYMPA